MSIIILYAVAQVQTFCFEGVDKHGQCSGALLGVVSSPARCCFPPSSQELGGGGFNQLQGENCFSCKDFSVRISVCAEKLTMILSYEILSVEARVHTVSVR